jgi:hypothetical protein
MSAHLVWMSFNGCDKTHPNGWRWAKTMANPEWWSRRAEVMRAYTLPSLRAQTFTEFEVWALFRPEELESPMARPVLAALDEFGVRAVADERVEITQRTLEPAEPICRAFRDRCDHLVLTRIDSDDLYARDALACVRAVEPSPGLVAGFLDGYIFEIATRRLACYVGRERPMPFYSMVYTAEALASPEAWRAYRVRWGHDVYHHQVKSCPNWRALPDGRFCITSNGTNTETTWATASGRGREILDGGERTRVLADFGLR